MKKMIFLFLTFSLTCSFAQRKVSALSPEEEAKFAFEQFKNCKAEFKDNAAKLIDCVSAHTASKTGKRLNQKISFWLMSLKHLGELETCPADKLALFPRAANGEFKALKCVSFTQESKNGAKGKALFYFKDEAGQMKIEGIQFM